MKQSDPGTEKSQEIAGYVKEGAMAYLYSQYKIIGGFFVIAFIVFAIMSFGMGVLSPWTPFAFLTGGFFSALAGYLGMITATNASNRTAAAASKSLNLGLQLAFRSGAVMGLTVVGLVLFDISVWWIILNRILGMKETMQDSVFLISNYREVTNIMLTFAMGASSTALFARVGGGIFTKAADVGADLVGKTEAGIPEDDPRNPAVIADNVGDNVGDVAGMGSDLYESYCSCIPAAMALGAAAFGSVELIEHQVAAILLPLSIAGAGIFFSLIGIYFVQIDEDASQKELMSALGRGINIAAGLVAVGSAILTYLLLPGYFNILGSVISGLMAGIIIGWATEHYTSEDYEPTREVAAQSTTGPATVIIEGVASGMMSTAIPVLTVSVTIVLAYSFAGGFADPSMGLYGIAIASVGMLSTLGITLATDAYGPIADNAGGNAEMAGLGPEVRKRTDALDSLGNTTAATGKGFAIGSAALTVMALLGAYIEAVRLALLKGANFSGEVLDQYVFPVADKAVPAAEATAAELMYYFNVHLMNPNVLIGLFIGSMLVFVFCAMTMKAVGRTAHSMVEEVRRQFKELPGLIEGKEGVKADYAACVAISTTGAQKEMIVPSVLAILTPVIIGLLLGVSGVIGLLVGGVSTGFAMAIMMANAGGTWDNAKKYVESGQLGGKGSDNHKATVVGDTVGDPFKDTSGPALNILIKLMAKVAVVVAGLTVVYSPSIQNYLGFEPTEVTNKRQFEVLYRSGEVQLPSLDATERSSSVPPIFRENPLEGAGDILMPEDGVLTSPPPVRPEVTPGEVEAEESAIVEDDDAFSALDDESAEDESPSAFDDVSGFDSFDSLDTEDEQETEDAAEVESDSDDGDGFGGFDAF